MLAATGDPKAIRTGIFFLFPKQNQRKTYEWNKQQPKQPTPLDEYKAPTAKSDLADLSNLSSPVFSPLQILKHQQGVLLSRTKDSFLSGMDHLDIFLMPKSSFLWYNYNRMPWTCNL